MPSLAGPGSIVVVMGFSSQIPSDHSIFGHAVIAIGVAIMSIIAYIGLLSSNWIEKFLGDHGMQAVTKIMGFLLTCLAVQFLASGISQFVVQFGKL